MLSKELRDFIFNASVVTNRLYFEELPETPNNCIAIIMSPAITVEYVTQQGIQILARNTVRSNAYDDAKKIHQLLHEKGIKDIILVNFTISWCTATTGILGLGIDTKNRFQYSVNFNLSIKSFLKN